MDNYIGCKMITAKRAIKKGGKVYMEGEATPKSMDPVEYGYKVVYPDGYESWSPKEVFEKAYLKVTPNPKLKTGCSISQDMVDGFIKDVQVITMGEKNTVVRATLVNGFEIVESSACVDPANYDESLGAEICMGKIKDKVWFLLGFLLQTAVGGVR